MKNENGRYGKPGTITYDSTEKYVAILRELPDIVYKIDPEGYFTFINKSVSVLGYNPDEIIGEHFSKIIHPEDVKLFSRNYVLPKYKGKSTGVANAPKLFDERRTGERKTKNLEIRLMPKNWQKAEDLKTIIGMVIAFGDVSASGYYDLDTGDGKRKFQGTLGIIRDVTERIKTEKSIIQKNKELEVLNEIAVSISSTLNMMEVLDRALDKTLLVLGLQVGSIYLMDRHRKKVDLVTYRGVAKAFADSVRSFKLGQSLCGRAAQSGKAIITSDLSGDGRVKTNLVKGQKIYSVAFTPLKSKGKVVGLLNVASHKARTFMPEEIHFLNTISNQIGVAIENAKLYAAVREELSERKVMLEALSKSEEKYRYLVENINDIIFAIDLNGIFTYVSPVMESLSGYKPADIIGKPFADFIYPEHLSYVKRRFQELMNGKEEPAEYKILTKSGEARWVRSSSKPIYKMNRLVGIQGVITDIDQHKHMEEKLQYQADMLANVSDAVISTDLDFRIRTWNKAAEKIYGWQAWEVIDKPVGRITRLVYPNDQQDKVIEKIFKEGYWQGEVVQIRKDGTKINVQTAVVLMKDSKGKSIGVVAVNRDVTSRRQAEERLVLSKAEWETTFNGMSDWICLVDRKSVVKRCNSAGEKFTGMPAEKLTGKNCCRLVHGSEKHLPGCPLAKTLKTKRTSSIELKTSGDDRWLKITTDPILDNGNNIVSIVHIVSDITEQKLAENRLRSALISLETQGKRMAELTKKIINAQEEERRYLAFKIHDEFLQGIVSILYFLQTFDVSSLGKEAQEQKEGLMKAVKDSIDKGRALITGTEPIRELDTGLIEAVKKTIALRFRGTAVKVRFIHPGKMPKLEKDIATSVFRVVQEALSNIQRHAKATSILVRMSVSNHDFNIEVRDNGVGFMPESVARKKTGHYGLLSMQERAHVLGGDLAITSKPGKGTMVKFKFSSS